MTVTDDYTLTAHAASTIEAKGFDPDLIEAVWRDPDVTYPSHKHRGQHKRMGQGVCLCCDDKTGKVITVFVNMVETDLRADQTDSKALAWSANRR